MSFGRAIFFTILFFNIGESSISSSNFENDGGVIYVPARLEDTPQSEGGLIDDHDGSPNTTLQLPKESKQDVSADGFNLLWLISARIHHQSRLNGHERFSQSRPTPPTSRAETSRRLFRHGLNLHSKLPKRILRYHRVSKNFSTLRISKRTRGKQVGFETEFRLKNTSGSGYLIIGRSLGKKGSTNGRKTSQSRRSSESPSSWFGLFSRVSSKTFSLRLEYRNAGWNSLQKFSTPLEIDNFQLGHWHNLTVQIDYNRNRIVYWVNCTRMRAIEIEDNRGFPSTNLNVYRLLQHKTRARQPVEVAFRSMIIIDGKVRDEPKQCANVTSTSSIPVCSGGHVFMECGPSCEQTCGTRHLPLTRCTSNCVRGCHCPPHQVYHNGSCMESNLCPCRIGANIYPSGSEMTINNEICNCAAGRWSCYAAASFARTPRNQTVMNGMEFNLTCGVSGNPLPRIRWEVPDGVDATIIYRPGSRKSQLYVRNVTLSTSGRYVCYARRDIDGWSEMAAAYIDVISPPVITSLPKTVTVTRGSPVATIDCQIRGTPPPRAAWLKKGTNPRFYSLPSGALRLKITNVNSSHAGEYKCVAKNVAGLAVRSVMVIVRLPAPNSMAFRRQPRNRCIKKGHTAVFPCQVIDHGPEVNVTWFKNGKILKNVEGRIVIKRNRLVVRNATRADAGTYSCLVAMGTSDMHAKAKLMIKGRMLPWSSWGPCSASCGGGWKYKRRKCTGVPPNEKTCHGRFSVMRRCNTFACPGVCSSYGDPHYTTLDGRRFNFQGDCSYILSQDVAGNTFKIIQYNVGCGSRLSCVRKVSIVLALPNLSAVVDLGRDHTVLLNGVPLALPFHAATANFSIVQFGLYLTLQVADHLEIRWATPHRFYVVVAGKYQGRTQGLCGNFNGDPSDDNLSPQGRTLNSDLEFGQSWAVKDGNANFSCSAVSTLSNPCGRNSVIAQQAKDTCLFLTDKSRFGPCHNVVHPGSYVTSCMLDICSTSLEKTNMYFCIALSAYAEDCLRKNVVLNWRSSDICPLNCDRGMVYHECGPTCVRYCPSKIEGGKVCLVQRKCVAGCYCPDGKVFHNGGCISVQECPCRFNGMVFANGSRHERNCQQCTCKGGGWHCVFNKRLCEFPASVVKDPQSQVVTLGRSVSFCCGVTGKPAPVVVWYLNGVRLNDTNSNNKSWKRDTLNSTLVLRHVSNTDLGSYSCKASNTHGSHLSASAMLKMFDPEMYSCNPTPSVNIVSLPDGCYVTNDEGKQNFVNLGRCTGDPCYGGSYTGDSITSCSPNRHCCQASTTSPVLVKCRHQSYVTSFLITVVRQCSCITCSERTTEVEGVVRNSDNDQPVRHVMLSYQGRTVGYTSSAGTFRIPLPNLPLETRHVTITVTDVMLRRFSTAIENLVVQPGRSTLHTIYMRPCQVIKEFNSRRGLQYVFRISDGYSHRMKLTILPNSLIHDRQAGAHRGRVKAGITLIDHNRPIKRGVNGGGKPQPGNPIAIGLMGNELLLSPSVTLFITLSSVSSHRRVDLLPGRFATLSLIMDGMGMKMQSWSLDGLTGLWRENKEGLGIEPRYTKTRDKILVASSKVKRLNTWWSLGVGETPCYLRAKVIDALNETVPGVKISFTKAHVNAVGAPRHAAETTRFKRNHKPLFSSRVEALTGSRSYPNGACLPVGCHDTGMLQASRLGNELVLLEPSTPASNMGRVKEMRAMTEQPGAYENTSIKLDASLVHNSTNMTSHYAYFRTRDECRDTSPSLQTYLFRDNSDPQDGSVLSPYQSNLHNNVILTFGMPSQRHSAPEPVLKYCHVKVRIQFHPTFNYSDPLQIEVVTFKNRTPGPKNSLLFLGWRTITLQPRDTTDGIVTQDACVEYLCGEVYLTDTEQLVLRVTLKEKNANGSQTSQLPRCAFSSMQSDYSRTNNLITDSRDHYVRGGHIYVRKMFNIRPRSYRTAREISNEYSAATLAESKERCSRSLPNDNISAYFQCL